MNRATSRRFTFPVTEGQRVSAILDMPEVASCCFVFAHGAGAGMEHDFMRAVAEGLVLRGIATLRYQFPFMENGSKRPDSPVVAHEVVRAGVAQAAVLAPGVQLIAGGKSFGGRMTSQAQASAPLPGVRGLVFVGFPLHTADKPSIQRAQHLENVRCPMLLLQGTRDKLADALLMSKVVNGLGKRATLESVQDADHGFHVLVRSGRNDAEVLTQIIGAIKKWSDQLLGQLNPSVEQSDL